MKIRGEVDCGQRVDFSKRRDGVLVFGTRLCVPADEAHNSIFSMHPDSTKMYRTLPGHYWWPGMKRDVAEFLSKCMVCQQVKAKRQIIWTFAAFAYSRIEVGTYYYGLCV